MISSHNCLCLQWLSLNNNIDKDISNLILGATLKMRRNPACDQDSGNDQASGCGALIAVVKPMNVNIVSSPQNSAAVLYWCLWHKFTIMLEWAANNPYLMGRKDIHNPCKWPGNHENSESGIRWIHGHVYLQTEVQFEIISPQKTLTHW